MRVLVARDRARCLLDSKVESELPRGLSRLLEGLLEIPPLLSNEGMTPFFVGVMDATEEALYNSLFMSTTIDGENGVAPAINLDAVRELLRENKLFVDPGDEPDPKGK